MHFSGACPPAPRGAGPSLFAPSQGFFAIEIPPPSAVRSKTASPLAPHESCISKPLYDRRLHAPPIVQSFIFSPSPASRVYLLPLEPFRGRYDAPGDSCPPPFPASRPFSSFENAVWFTLSSLLEKSPARVFVRPVVYLFPDHRTPFLPTSSFLVLRLAVLKKAPLISHLWRQELLHSTCTPYWSFVSLL